MNTVLSKLVVYGEAETNNANSPQEPTSALRLVSKISVFQVFII